MIGPLALQGCQRVAPVRTLPAWVRGVYIPMIHNQSYEPGIEEQATRLTQEAFMNDGRLDVVPKKDADLSVVVTILNWRDHTAGTNGGRIVGSVSTTILADVKLYDPADDSKPLADLGRMPVISTFNVDTRSSYFVPEPDRIKAILTQLAQQVVYKTIVGFPAGLRNLPAGTTLPTINTNPVEVRPGDVLRPRGTEDR